MDPTLYPVDVVSLGISMLLIDSGRITADLYVILSFNSFSRVVALLYSEIENP